MDIYWHGQSCFEIKTPSNQAEKKKIVIDPYTKDYGLRLPKLEADLLLITHDHKDHNNVKGVDGTPFVIKGAGEYEIKSIFIHGIPASHGEDLGETNIYTIEVEGIRVCHLGDVGQQLTDDQVEKIGDVDILMVPIGGQYTVDGEGAQKIIKQIEPKVVIPMHYDITGLKLEKKLDDVKGFLKTMGYDNITPESSFKVKKGGLPPEMKIVVLKP